MTRAKTFDYSHLKLTPVPASRPRVTRRGTYNAPRYAAFKAKLTAGIRDWMLAKDWRPTPTDRYELVFFVYRQHKRGDIDNYLKGIQDALQESGAILNDAHILSVRGVLIDKSKKIPEARGIRLVLRVLNHDFLEDL
jgi:Holliday junction resolvase RusA-like endonuclease